jgi:hypothetical protein
MFPKQAQINPVDDLRRRMDRMERALLRLDLYNAGMFAIELAKIGLVSGEELLKIIENVSGQLKEDANTRGDDLPWVKNQAA